MYSLIRPWLFKIKPERAHEAILKALDYLPSACIPRPKIMQGVSALGLQFPHAVGLAAGFDKNGAHLQALAKLGFAFIELGTVTPKPQAGNPLPRLFRLPEAEALINRMGFNNAGVDVLVANVMKSDYQGILGINIGKNKDTSLENAALDYIYCMEKAYAHASYITINVSSPNTQGLRQLQQKEALNALLSQLAKAQQRLADKHRRWLPLLLKISPDETEDTLKAIAEAAILHGMAGIIVSNTTCAREGVIGLPHAEESGGLSGKPLFARSTACLKLLKKEVGEGLCLLGVGGIDGLPSAEEKLQKGATLLQVYTGWIYGGPLWLKGLVEGLAHFSKDKPV